MKNFPKWKDLSKDTFGRRITLCLGKSLMLPICLLVCLNSGGIVLVSTFNKTLITRDYIFIALMLWITVATVEVGLEIMNFLVEGGNNEEKR